MFTRRLGAGGTIQPCKSTFACPAIWSLADGEIAVIGRDMTEFAHLLPADAGCAPEERIVRIPRSLLIAAVADIPQRAVEPASFMVEWRDGKLHWTQAHWFELASTAGIVGGLLLDAYARHSDTKTRKVSNNLKLTEGHRHLWLAKIQVPSLKRVTDPKAEPEVSAITEAEWVFALLVILHSESAFKAKREELLIAPEAFRKDIRSFYSLPIPRAVWKEVKDVQDADFAAFVDSCLNEGEA